MNPQIKKLAQTAQKPSRRIIGLMSGTSLDGLDIALCTIKGSGSRTSVTLEKFKTVPYSDHDRELLGRISSVETVKLGDLCFQHTRLGVLHAEMILDTLGEWGVSGHQIDAIASHGQTVYHLPSKDNEDDDMGINTTLQIGDADQIASITRILTISDFRQKHTASGGEGAPMAGLVDEVLFSHPKENRVLLNIGGIGNFTYLPAGGSDEPFTTDTGPGNTLIDRATQVYMNKPFDKDGEIAAGGSVHESLLNAMLSDPFLSRDRSKSTGPEYFSLKWVDGMIEESGADGIEPADLIATLTELSAVTISDSIKSLVGAGANPVVYVSGGGAHNRHLIKRIGSHLGSDVKPFTELGLDPDAKEAVIFAVLANETLAGEGFLMDIGIDERIQVNFGKISFPE